jgi:anaerobic ribonucleoside-triphosphate reductase activating protein
VKAFKLKYPSKTVWVWTGYMYEDIESFLPTELDVLVDGRFEEASKDLRLKYRGSSNQRVIDVKESLKTSTIKLLDY